MWEVALFSFVLHILTAFLAIGIYNLVERFFCPPTSNLIWRESRLKDT